MTFGVQEAKDLSQVIDALGGGACWRRLGVCGISYGATTSIHLAPSTTASGPWWPSSPSPPPGRRCPISAV